MNLLNHTSGLGWDILTDTGEGDDALASFVPKLAELELVAPLGTRASYSQAGYSLLGRVIEKVLRMPYEKAVASLIFEPLGLSHSFFAAGDVLTRRFAVGHNRGEDAAMPVARLWRGPRYRNAGGGLASSVADQMRWARFHLGDGRAQSGARVLPAEMLHRMKEPTAACGQHARRRLRHRLVPARRGRRFAPSATAGPLTASSPSCSPCPESAASPSSRCPTPARTAFPFNQAAVRWALQTYLGVTERDPRAASLRPSAGPGVRRALRERRDAR